MHPLIITEISRGPDDSLPAELLTSAYVASRRGRIVLVLNDISPFEVDDILDLCVRALPLDIPGVLYRDAADETSLARIVPQAAMLFLSAGLTQHWTALPGCSMGRFAPLAAALSVFQRLGKPTSMSELIAVPASPVDTPFE